MRNHSSLILHFRPPYFQPIILFPGHTPPYGRFPGLPVQIANASAAVIYKMAIAFEHTVPCVLLGAYTTLFARCLTASKAPCRFPTGELLVKDMEEPGPESVLLVEIHKYEIRRKKPFIFAKKII